MRDLYYDAGFMRDFNEASKQWAWASWHQAQATRDATASRLLAEVFGAGDDGAVVEHDGEGQPEE